MTSLPIYAIGHTSESYRDFIYTETGVPVERVEKSWPETPDSTDPTDGFIEINPQFYRFKFRKDFNKDTDSFWIRMRLYEHVLNGSYIGFPGRTDTLCTFYRQDGLALYRIQYTSTNDGGSSASIKKWEFVHLGTGQAYDMNLGSGRISPFNLDIRVAFNDFQAFFNDSQTTTNNILPVSNSVFYVIFGDDFDTQWSVGLKYFIVSYERLEGYDVKTIYPYYVDKNDWRGRNVPYFEIYRNNDTITSGSPYYSNSNGDELTFLFDGPENIDSYPSNYQFNIVGGSGRSGNNTGVIPIERKNSITRELGGLISFDRSDSTSYTTIIDPPIDLVRDRSNTSWGIKLVT